MRSILAVGMLVSLLAGIDGPSAAAETPSGTRFDFDSIVAEAESMPRLHSLLISRRGELVLERYFNGRDADDVANVKSVSKSIVSALVGIAIARGAIPGVDATLGDYFQAQLVGEPDKARITIGDLLTMRAGLETTSNRNYGAWVLSDDWVAYALGQPQLRPPGTDMTYSTGNTHLLSAILTRATERSTLSFAQEVLAGPLGFDLAQWPRDPQGIYFGGNDMELTPRQMLAFGELYLNDGKADGRQVVPAEWVDESLQRRTRSPRGEGRYYGYGWWSRDMAGYQVPYAWGYGGQFILLVPDLDVAIVTTSASTPGADRRAHTRGLYDFVEDDIIPTVAAQIR
jgi:CubicO group peptidase (beta-lactamase class C family)